MPQISPFSIWARRLRPFLKARLAARALRARSGANQASSLPNDQFELGDHRLWVPKLGWVNMAENLRFTGKITGARITKTADWWFISIQVEIPDAVPAKRPAAVGIDVGLNRLASCSPCLTRRSSSVVDR
jgi:putative transposase